MVVVCCENLCIASMGMICRESYTFCGRSKGVKNIGGDEYMPPPLQKMRITSELLRELVFSFQCVFLLHHLLFHPQLIPLNIQMS